MQLCTLHFSKYRGIVLLLMLQLPFYLYASRATIPAFEKLEYQTLLPTVEIQITAGGQEICSGTRVSFTATPTNGGLVPLYQWKINGVNVGTNAENPIFTSTTLLNGEVITCVMTSNDPAANPTTALSNGITMRVDATPRPTMNAVPNQTLCAGANLSPISFTGTGVNAYLWTNNKDSTGIAKHGVNNIASLVARNTGTTPITSTITVTPSRGSTGYFYVGSHREQRIIAFDKQHQMVARIPFQVDFAFPSVLAVSPTGNHVYICDGKETGSMLSVLNTSSQSMVKMLPMGRSPEGIALNSDGTRLYVPKPDSSLIAVMNTLNDEVVARVQLPLNSWPVGIGILPNNSRVYVANSFAGTVTAINALTNTVITTIPVGNFPIGIVVSPDGSKVYVTNSADHTVSVIQTATNAVSATIPVEFEPRTAAITPNGNHLYVCNFLSNSVSVINTVTNAVVATIPIASPIGVSATPDGNHMYVVQKHLDNVTMISTATHTVTDTLIGVSEPISSGESFRKTTQFYCEGVPTTFAITVLPSETPAVSVEMTAGTQPACSQQSIIFAATTRNASPSTTYQWFKNRVALSGATNPTYTGSNWARNDSITCQITTTRDCPTPGSGFTVMSEAFVIQLTANITGIPTGCGNIRLTASGGTQYQWSGGATPNDATNTFTISGNYTVTVTDATGCRSVVSKMVTILAPPTLQAGVNRTVCAEDSVSMASFLGTGAPRFHYQWTNSHPSIGLAANGEGNIPIFKVNNPTTAPITATITASITSNIPDWAYLGGFDTLLVVNPDNQTIVKKIPMMGDPYGVVVSPNGSRVYVTYEHSNQITVLHTETNQILNTITVDDDIRYLMVSPNGNRIYVGTAGNAATPALLVIDAATHQVIATLPWASAISSIVVSPDNRKVYIVDYSSNISVMDAATNTLISLLPTAQYILRALSISPEGNRLYVGTNGNLLVVNLATQAITPLLSLSGGVDRLLLNPEGSRLYIHVAGENIMMNTVTNTFDYSLPAGDLSMNADGSLLYLLAWEIFRTVDTRTNTVLSSFSAYFKQAKGQFIRQGQNGCAGNSTSFTVTVSPKPSVTIAITAGTAAICNNAAITFAATPTQGGATPRFQWYKNGIAINGATNATYTNTVWVNGDSIHCVMVSATCPTAVSSSKIGISTVFRPQIVGDTIGCGSIRLTVTNGIRYLWSGGATPTAATNTFTTSGTYQVTVTHAEGCVATASRTISIGPMPTLQPLTNRNVCAGSTDSIPPFSVGNATSYSWTNNHPEIGLPSYGVGPMGAFTALNSTQSPIIATIAAVATAGRPEYAYIPNSNSQDISVVNLFTNQVVSTIPLEGDIAPYSVAVSPDGNRVYIGGYAGGILILSTVTHSVLATVPISGLLTSIVVAPTGNKVYIIADARRVYVMDATTYEITTVTQGNTGVFGLCLNRDGSRLYVSNGSGDNVSIFNTDNNSIVATIPFENGAFPKGLTLNPNGNLLYVANHGLNAVSIVDVATNRPTKTIPITGPPQELCMSPDGKRVYITCINSVGTFISTVEVIDTEIDTVIATLWNLNPAGVSVSGDNRRVYIANPSGGQLWVLNATDNTIENRIRVGSLPYAWGSFIRAGRVTCTSNPRQFTITVHPTTPPTLAIEASPRGAIVRGTPVTFTATPTTGGVAPAFQWKKNGILVGTNSRTYADANLANNDVITCVLTSNAPCITQRTVTSTLQMSVLNLVIPSVSIAIVSGSATLCAGMSVSFLATATNGGTNPVYQWKKNGLNVGINHPSFTHADWATGDVITCVLTNADLNASPNTVTSNRITMTLNNTAVIHAIAPQTLCAYATTVPIALTGTNIMAYSWTNSNPAIGLRANGAGNIPTFQATNPTGAPITATITVHNSRAAYAYIPAVGSDSVWVIHMETQEIVAIIPVGAGPSGVAVSPDGNRVYITNSLSNNVSVIHTATNTVINTIRVGEYPEGVAVSPNGVFLYVANNQSNDVSVINTIGDTVIATIPVGQTPESVVVSPDGSRVYVSNVWSSNLSVINAETNTVLRTISVGENPDGMAITADGSKLYVANWGSNRVDRINTATNEVEAQIRVESLPHGVALNPANTRLYVTNYDSNSVSVINTATDNIIGRIAVGKGPYSVDISADGSQAYVVNGVSNDISVINTATHSVVATIPIGIKPYAIGKFIKPAPAAVCGVVAPMSFRITVNPATPVSVAIAITAGDSTTCLNSSITFAATPTQGGTAPTYQWYKNDVAIAGATRTLYTGTNWTDADVISCNMTSNAACPYPTTAISNRMVITTANITGLATDCRQVQLTATGGIRYQWSDGETPNDATNRFSTSGTYNVTVTGIGGCTSVLSKVVKVLSAPTVNPIPHQTVCSDGVSRSLPFTGAPDSTTYLWAQDNPEIYGLEKAGLGNIPLFKGNGSTQITVTPFIGSPEYAYITHSNEVSVMDTRLHRRVQKIQVGTQAYGVSVSSDRRFVYVTNEISNNVSVISTATHTVIATIPVGAAPKGISVSPDNRRVFVANYKDHTVSVINAVANTVIATLPLGAAAFPIGICVHPDGNNVYVAQSGLITVINPITNRVVTKIRVQNGATGLTMNPSGSRLYVTHRNSNTVSTIHTGTNQVIATTRVGESPWGIAVSPDGGKVYVANEYSANVSVIDAMAHVVVATIPVGSGSVGISVTPDGSQLYVANRGSATVQAINLTTYAITTFNLGVEGVTAFGNFIKPSNSHCMGNPTTFRLTMNSLPFPFFNMLQNQSDAGSVVRFDNISSSGTMLWHFGDPLNSTSTERNPTFWYRENGIYRVTLKVTDAAGCSDSTFRDIRVSGARTDLKALSLPWKVTVSPNPFSERLQLTVDNQSFTFRGKERLLVTNGIGQLVYEKVWNAPTLELDTQTWSEGIYNLTLDADGVKIPLQKVVKYLR